MSNQCQKKKRKGTSYTQNCKVLFFLSCLKIIRKRLNELLTFNELKKNYLFLNFLHAIVFIVAASYPKI